MTSENKPTEANKANPWILAFFFLVVLFNWGRTDSGRSFMRWMLPTRNLFEQRETAPTGSLRETPRFGARDSASNGLRTAEANPAQQGPVRVERPTPNGTSLASGPAEVLDFSQVHMEEPASPQPRALLAQATETLPDLSTEQIVIEPSPDADERLFLLRVLDVLYRAWPADISDPQAFAASVVDLRRSALKFKQRAEDAGLDAELPRLFSDYLDALDAYRRFLLKVEAIEEGDLVQAERDQLETAFDAGFAGGSVLGTMQNNDFTNLESAGAAVIVGAATFALDAWQKKEERDSVKEQAIADEAQRLSDRVTAALVRAQSTARELTERHGWARREAGFEIETSSALVARVSELLERGDLAAVVRLAEAEVAARPRDPFARVTRNLWASMPESTSSAATLRNARDCVAAAALVPRPSVYDEFRTICLYYAAGQASAARLREVEAGIEPLGRTAASRYAVLLCREVLNREPVDPTGENRERLAWAYMDNDQPAEGLKAIRDVVDLRRKVEDSSGFEYNYSRLLSRAGETDRALRQLEYAMSQGFPDVAYIRRDPHLTKLRLDNATEFAELTRVKTEWNIDWGFFNDDITLTNRSKFPLTSVVLDVTIRQDARVWNKRLETDAIMPGTTHRWVNAVSIPGSRFTSRSATLHCDQN